MKQTTVNLMTFCSS